MGEHFPQGLRHFLSKRVFLSEKHSTMAAMRTTRPIDWIWIWNPDSYLDADGKESRRLLPGRKFRCVGTCHPDTEPGQIVILYRTTPKKDVAYLLRTVGPAMINEKWRPRTGTRGKWNYMAEFEVLARISPSISIQELRDCPDLENFAALRRQMWGSFFRVGPQDSLALWRLMNGRLSPSVSTILKKSRPATELPLESVIESAFANNLKTVGRALGRDLKIWTSPDGVKGRQLPCPEAGGRMDLLCVDQKTQDFVLLELKAVKAKRDTYGQICSYLGWIRKHVAGKRNVHAVVLADGQDAAFQSALGAGSPIEFHEIRPLAKKLKLIS
jgi:hypothetical protein